LVLRKGRDILELEVCNTNANQGARPMQMMEDSLPSIKGFFQDIRLTG
jgi:hypothetical protein